MWINKYFSDQSWLSALALTTMFLTAPTVQAAPNNLSIVVGWNLLGNSTGTALAVADTFGDQTTVSSVWKWLPQKSNWAFYAPTQADGGVAYAASVGYEPLTSVARGEGFWVKATAAFSASLPADAAIDPPSFKNMATGWNLIAAGGNMTAREFNNALSSTPSAPGAIPNNLTSLWAWDAVLGTWYFYAPSLDASGELAAHVQSKGYLDFTASNKRLEPHSGFWVNQSVATGSSSAGLPPGFAIGAKSTSNLSASAAQEIVEPVSGFKFLFPSGAFGTLSVARITAAPNRPVFGGVGFNMEFSGSEAVKIKLPLGSADQLLGYAVLGASDSIESPTPWLALPADDSNPGFLVFELVKPADVSVASTSRAARPATAAPTAAYKGFNQYWITKLNPSDTDKRVAIGLQAALDIDNWLNALPASIQASARAEVAGRLKIRHTYYDGNYYIGFTRHGIGGTWFAAPTPMLGLTIDSDAGSIAHEIGHYMTHVLAGDVLYRAIDEVAPDEWHALGKAHPGGRVSVTEDYAYFSQYFLTGAVGAADPINSLSIFAGKSPAKVDMPSVEGFGTVLLANITRTAASTVALVSKKLENAPVVGASFGDIASLIARGASNINILQTYLEDYLRAKGQDSKLPAIAERIGWSYSATGRVLDALGVPLGDATVAAISMDGSTVYGMPAPTVSGNPQLTAADGTFFLPRIFPGKSFIRIGLGTQVFDAPVSVDWLKPTTERITLGDLASNLIYKPEIDAISPQSGQAGTQVTITGTGFGIPTETYASKDNHVSFSGITTSTSSWTDTRITFTIPTGVATGAIVVTAHGAVSNAKTFTIAAACSQVDTLTGLTWPIDGNSAGKTLTLTQAKSWVASALLCGLGGWRLPTVAELHQVGPQLRAAPFVNNQGSYWTSQECVSTFNGTSAPGGSIVWTGIYYPDVDCVRDNTYSRDNVWPVRP